MKNIYILASSYGDFKREAGKLGLKMEDCHYIREANNCRGITFYRSDRIIVTQSFFEKGLMTAEMSLSISSCCYPKNTELDKICGEITTWVKDMERMGHKEICPICGTKPSSLLKLRDEILRIIKEL